jgi:tetratricopeptide (TPR) repeat protein
VLLFFVLGRYRMPLVPPLMLFAAAGLWEAAGIAPRAIARARSGGRGWTGASRRQPENTGKPRTAGGWGRCARSDDLETSANASPPAERPSAHRWGRAERPYPVSRVEGRPDPSRPSGASALGIQPLGGRAVLGRLSVALAVSAITAVPVNVAPYPVGDAKAVTRENLGDHLYRAGFPHDLVLEQYERAVALTPDSPPLRRHYAKVLWDMGRRDAARQQLETLLARHPDDVPTLVDLGLLLRDEKRFAPAIDRLRAAVSAAPDWPEPRYQLAVALLKWADHLAAGAAAVALEDTSVSSERNDIVAGLKKTEALRREAVSQLRRGLELDPDSEPAHAALGTALAALGEKEEAAQEFGAAAELAPPGSERQARLRSAAQRLEPSPKARPRDLDGVGR